MGVSESRLNCIRSLLLTGVGDSGKAKPMMEFTFPVIYNCAVNFYFALFFLPAFFPTSSFICQGSGQQSCFWSDSLSLPLLWLLAFNSYQIAVELKALISFTKSKRTYWDTLRKKGSNIHEHKTWKKNVKSYIQFWIFSLCTHTHIDQVVKGCVGRNWDCGCGMNRFGGHFNANDLPEQWNAGTCGINRGSINQATLIASGHVHHSPCSTHRATFHLPALFVCITLPFPAQVKCHGTQIETETNVVEWQWA